MTRKLCALWGKTKEFIKQKSEPLTPGGSRRHSSSLRANFLWVEYFLSFSSFRLFFVFLIAHDINIILYLLDSKWEMYIMLYSLWAFYMLYEAIKYPYLNIMLHMNVEVLLDILRGFWWFGYVLTRPVPSRHRPSQNIPE